MCATAAQLNNLTHWFKGPLERRLIRTHPAPHSRFPGESKPIITPVSMRTELRDHTLKPERHTEITSHTFYSRAEEFSLKKPSCAPQRSNRLQPHGCYELQVTYSTGTRDWHTNARTGGLGTRLISKDTSSTAPPQGRPCQAGLLLLLRRKKPPKPLPRA